MLKNIFADNPNLLNSIFAFGIVFVVMILGVIVIGLLSTNIFAAALAGVFATGFYFGHYKMRK